MPRGQPRLVRLGSREVRFPGPELAELNDTSNLLAEPEALRERFDRDGYLYLRSVLPTDGVEDARRAVLRWADEGASTADLRRQAREEGPVRRLVEHPALFAVADDLLGETSMTYSFKWLRTTSTGGGTGAHCDAVYMGRGSRRVRTFWIPFGATPVERGTLTVCEASHRLPAFEEIRRRYGALDVDRDRIEDTGWFTNEPLQITGAQWKTADFEAGDVIVFDLYTMHASTINVQDEPRLSCDVRFQPASESADKRWVGDEPVGHAAFGHKADDSTTVEELRRRWGL